MNVTTKVTLIVVAVLLGLPLVILSLMAYAAFLEGFLHGV